MLSRLLGSVGHGQRASAASALTLGSGCAGRERRGRVSGRPRAVVERRSTNRNCHIFHPSPIQHVPRLGVGLAAPQLRRASALTSSLLKPLRVDDAADQVAILGIGQPRAVGRDHPALRIVAVLDGQNGVGCAAGCGWRLEAMEVMEAIFPAEPLVTVTVKLLTVSTYGEKHRLHYLHRLQSTHLNDLPSGDTLMSFVALLDAQPVDSLSLS
jgi:hypothetical protein